MNLYNALRILFFILVAFQARIFSFCLIYLKIEDNCFLIILLELALTTYRNDLLRKEISIRIKVL